MSEFKLFNLSDIIAQLGEDRTKSILSSFSCPINNDIQDFMRFKAIEFSKRGFAKTHLVYWQEGKEKELVGYFSIALQYFTISKHDVSQKLMSRIKQHGKYDHDTKRHIVTAPLIGQLGKNYTNGNDTLIYGDELLKLALDKIFSIQREIGGKFVYLECEDRQKLLDFYGQNGFVPFGRRYREKRDIGRQEDNYLIKLFRYMHEQ